MQHGEYRSDGLDAYMTARKAPDPSLMILINTAWLCNGGSCLTLEL